MPSNFLTLIDRQLSFFFVKGKFFILVESESIVELFICGFSIKCLGY